MSERSNFRSYSEDLAKTPGPARYSATHNEIYLKRNPQEQRYTNYFSTLFPFKFKANVWPESQKSWYQFFYPQEIKILVLEEPEDFKNAEMFSFGFW